MLIRGRNDSWTGMRMGRSAVERGNICMFLYVLIREIRGHLRERSGFAAICVGIFALDLKDHEWARMITNFPGTMELLYS